MLLSMLKSMVRWVAYTVRKPRCEKSLTDEVLSFTDLVLFSEGSRRLHAA